MNKTLDEFGRRLTYTFRRPELLEQALTHRSKGAENYERLEFLGDSVLGFTISSELYNRYPALSEGELTRLRASLVNKNTLAALARDIGIGNYLRLGEGELKSGGYDRDSILADSLEAVLGAICKDSSADEVARVILHLYHERLARLNPHSVPKDPKTQLQEHLQKQSLPTPTYVVREITGEAHNQNFVVECQVTGLDAPVQGRGTSRRHAEQEAAARVLDLLSHR
ncbi:ribonuclease III [Sulfuricaulis sp.]|uniref:ribonuclease III n=1 Tax=Sulfuricaulis sp. TaxID=2003553 RepID=UPI00355963BA